MMGLGVTENNVYTDGNEIPVIMMEVINNAVNYPKLQWKEPSGW